MQPVSRCVCTSLRCHLSERAHSSGGTQRLPLAGFNLKSEIRRASIKWLRDDFHNVKHISPSNFSASWANLFAAVARCCRHKQWFKCRDLFSQRGASFSFFFLFSFKGPFMLCASMYSQRSELFTAATGSLLTRVLPLFLLSGESATAAPRPNSEYRLYWSGFHQSSPLPLPLISLILFSSPFYSLYYILVLLCAWLNKCYGAPLGVIIKIFFFSEMLNGSRPLMNMSLCLDLTSPKISCFVHINTRIVGGHQVRGTDGSWVVSIQREWVLSHPHPVYSLYYILLQNVLNVLRNVHLCGGSLIREYWVLTDQQCFTSW